MTGVVLSDVNSTSTWRDGLLTILNFIVSAVVFLINSLVSLLSSIGRLFIRIFTGEFFGSIMEVFDYLSIYLGTSGATLFMGLFGLAFFLIIFGLVFRLLKGRVNYDSTLKKYNKNHPSK